MFLIGNNLTKTSLSSAVVPLLATLGAIAILFWAGTRVSKSPRKTAIVLSAVALLFFAYGHVWRLAPRDAVLAPLWLIAAAVLTVCVVRTRRSLVDTTRVLNVIGAVLLASTLVTIATHLGSTGARLGPPHIDGSAPDDPRDIYYLVFDRYPDAETLGSHFGFDNSPFIDFLEDNGFVVAHGSRANYQNTHLSLASSLNVSYLDGLREDTGPTDDLQPAFDAIRDHEVGRFLRSRGYRHIHIGSWWAPTGSSPTADMSTTVVPLSEFTRTFYASTALAPLLRRGLIGGAEVGEAEVQAGATRRQLEALDQAIEAPGPKFVFAHFLIPHPPYVFDRDGSMIEDAPREGNVMGFLDQLRFTNEKIEGIVGRLLDGPDAADPIVIVQADEGPYPRLSTDIPRTWVDRPDPDIRVKFGILNAYFLPDGGTGIHRTISPVNSFRVIFNTYFGTELELLPDESYAARGPDDTYGFVPLGDRVRGRPSGKMVP